MPRRALRVLIALTATTAAATCAEPDLGDAPFLCNHGTPQCPDGYVCVDDDGASVCIRPGLDRRRTTAPDRGVAADAGSTVKADGAPLPADTRPAADSVSPLPDRGVTVDQAVRTPDGGITYPDAGSGHLGCQSNAECDVDAPCCCPFPLLPEIWTCLPLCFDPFCAG